MTDVLKMKAPPLDGAKDPNDARNDPQFKELVEAAAIGEKNRNEGFQLLELKRVRENLKGPQYLIKPFVERETLNVSFGESGAYKTFVELDLGLCVAFGVDYHGYKVHQGPVVYICGEGKGGISRRIEAWLIKHGLTGTDAPFYLSTVPAELLSEGNAEGIAEVISETCADPVLIIIDTLSTNIGEGDESSNPDVAMLIKNVNRHFRDRFSASVRIVHHVGHGTNDRERGAYAIRANADSRILIKREADHSCSMHCKKMKDGPEFQTVAFNAHQVILPGVYDSEGEPVSSLVMEMTEFVESASDGGLTQGQKQALATLELMYSEAAKNLERAGRDASVAIVETKQWLDRLQAQQLIGKSRSSRTKIKSQLNKLNRITEEGVHVHLVGVIDDK